VSQDEGHLLLREVQTVRYLLCPLMIVALLHGFRSLPCIAPVYNCQEQLTLLD
jgi:hypothetical protein